MATFLVNQLDFHAQKLEEACVLGNWEGAWYHTQRFVLVQEQLHERAKLARRYAYKKACYGTPKLVEKNFERILASDDDCDYINYLTLNKEAFVYTVRKAISYFKPNRPSTLEPGRAPKRSRGAPAWALTCEGVTALTLRWLSTRHRQKDLQLEFGCSQGVISKSVKEGLVAIVRGLRNDSLAKVVFPDRAERDGMVELIHQQYGKAPYQLRIFCCADGTLFLCDRPPTEELQLKMYSVSCRATVRIKRHPLRIVPPPSPALNATACASCPPPPPPPTHRAKIEFMPGTIFLLLLRQAASSLALRAGLVAITTQRSLRACFGVSRLLRTPTSTWLSTAASQSRSASSALCRQERRCPLIASSGLRSYGRRHTSRLSARPQNGSTK